MKTALTIAGSDSSGGAGVQADIKTMTLHGVYATSVITALTAQNTCGISMIEEVSPVFVRAQLDSVFQDIYPGAVKIGMLHNAKVVEAVAMALRTYKAANVVLDPVFMSTSGRPLLEDGAVDTLVEELFPLANLITPNIPEAAFLLAERIETEEEMKEAAWELSRRYSSAVLLKGGHSDIASNDVLASSKGLRVYASVRIDNPNTHGTGCTLSSAIAANLAKGMEMEEAVKKAKLFVYKAIEARLNLGRGRGPLNHHFDLKSSFAE